MQLSRTALIDSVLSAQLSSLNGTELPDTKTTELLTTLCWMLADSSEPVPRSREGIYRVCHAVAKQYDIYPEMRALMRVQWGASSMRDLTDAALRALYHFMRALEQHIKTHAR